MAELSILEDVLERARRSGSLNDCLAGLAELLGAEFPIDRAIVGLLHPKHARLALVGVWAAGSTQIRPGAFVRAESTAFPQLREGEEIVTTPEDAQVGNLPLLEKILWIEGIRSIVSIPLRTGSIPVGILILASRVPGAFSEEHRLLFSTLGMVSEKTMVQLGRRRLDEMLRASSG